MSANVESKRAVVAEVSQIAERSLSAVAAEYSGLTVADMTLLRGMARDANVCVKVVRNTLARRALKDSKFSCMCDSLSGPLVLGFSIGELGGAARVFEKFSRDNEALKVKFLVLDGQLLESSALGAVASMPSTDEARAMLLQILSAPLSRFVQVLSDPSTRLLRLLVAKKDKA